MSTLAEKQSRAAKFARRKVVNNVATTLALAAMSFGLFWLFWILWETLLLGIGGLSVATFTQMTPPPNDEGGLANAIFGSLLMVVLATWAGHAHRGDGGYLSGRVQYQGLAGVFDAFCE
jgi:phosphate transport system permease protein